MTSKTSTGRYATVEADKLLKNLTRQISQTLKSPGTDQTHDLRVAIRRFTRALVVLKPCFPGPESRRLRRDLKEILEQAGKVRDFDIAVYLATKISPAAPDATTLRIQQERQDAALALSSLLRRWVSLNRTSAWRAAEKSAVARRGDKTIRAAAIGITAMRVLPPIVDRFFRRGKDAVRDGASAHVIHRFRIAAKHLRYSLELFAPLYRHSLAGNALAGLSDQLKQIQDLLGDINDAATVRRMLPGTAGRELLSGLKKREKKKTNRFREDYGPLLSSAEMRRQWTNAIRDAGSPVKRPAKITDTRRPV